MNSYVISLIRTWVPVGVGAVAAWLIARGIHIPATLRDGLIPLLTAGITGAYYAAVRWAEGHWAWVGVLLGHKAKPVYPQAG